ncbi:MAG: glycosyltransferase family 4 protein [Fibrobacter sp.]|nr:glycosyltransferase family 4 protein [Fibrobacter sp.]
MRACMVAYTHYEPDNRVRRYAEYLADLGWEVDAVVLRKVGQEKQKVVGNVNVFRIQERVHNEKSKLTYFLRIFRFLFNSALFLALKQFSRKKYDLVHVHSVPDYEVFAAIVPKLLGAKVILDIHDIVPELFLAKFKANKDSFAFRILLLMERLSTGFADHVIIANHIWYERIVERSVDRKKCSVIMNFPDTNIFGGKSRERNDDDFVMLYPGTLSRHQGIEMVINVLSRIRKDVPRLKFFIYGNGTDEKFLKDLTNKLGLSDIIKFFDSVSLEKIASVMANADMGIEPKRQFGFSDEAFSTKIFEFMLLGVPVVASDTSIHRYYISEEYVKYFKAGDEEDLAESIRLFYNNKELRDSYVLRASLFIKGMCWNVRSDEYMNIINSLLQVPENVGVIGQ